MMISANLDQARFNMVYQQIRTWDVVDQRVIDLLETLPRDHFAPDEYANLAYTDTEIPLGNGQRMMAPKIEAKLLQALDVQPSHRILEIGTGSGFLAACLAKLGNRVVSVEIDESFIPAAKDKLMGLGINNVDIRHLDGLAAPIDGGPYDIIVVTGSLPVMGDQLKQQLKVGGRLFAVLGEGAMMVANLITRPGESDWRTTELFETELTPLINAPRPSRFSF